VSPIVAKIPAAICIAFFFIGFALLWFRYLRFGLSKSKSNSD